MLKRAVKVSVISSFILFTPLASANIFNYIFGTKPKPATIFQANSVPTTTYATKTVGYATSGIFAANNWSNNSSNSPFDINAEAQKLSSEAQNLDPKIIKLGLEAYLKAREQGLDKQQILTIVNYDQPSTNARLFVFDLKTNNLLFKELVAHGKNSGDNKPTSFSNTPSSLKSSLGVFLTQNTYVGHHGYSLRLAGLEKGFNDMAAAREIVVHAASYVNTAFARAHGRLGKSWGCFAVDPSISSELISTIKNGTLIFAYYPDRNYLSRSRFLT